MNEFDRTLNFAADSLAADGRPIISVTSTSAIENSSNFAVFSLQLSSAAVEPVVVSYRLLSRSAQVNDIFNSFTDSNTNGTFVFNPGQTSGSISIRLTDDSLDERDESLVLELYNPSGGVFTDLAPVLRTTAFVLDNDGTGSNFSFFVSEPVIVEADSGTSEAVFEVRLSRPATSNFTVAYTTSDGSAVAGEDYTATSGFLSFVTGQSTATVRVSVRGDLTPEAAESFFLVLTAPTNPSVGTSGLVGTATILDTDTSPLTEISIAAASVVEGTEFLRFVVTLSQPAIDAVTVNFRTLRGTASEADIFEDSGSRSNNGVLTFAPGQTSKDIFIRAGSDFDDERDENIFVELFNPVNAAFAGGTPVLSAAGVILDNDGTSSDLSIFVSNPTLLEGAGIGREALFEVRLSRPAETAFNVAFATIDGSATAGSDYVAKNGTLSFVPGQEVAYVRVGIVGDSVGESSESFFLAITPPANPSIGVAGLTGTATILDDDTSQGPVISVSGDQNIESSGSFLRFVITLSKPSLDEVRVNFRTLLNSANESDLFDLSTNSSINNGTVVFAPGQTSASVFIRPNGDSLDERDEHFTLELFAPVGGVFAGNLPVLRATGVILDDDGAGSNLSIIISDPVLVEGDSGAKEALFEVRLSRPAESAFTVSYATRDGSAQAGSDYTATTGTLSFVPGQTASFVRVPLLTDNASEATETFFLSITPPTSPGVGPYALGGMATILDDDTGVGPVLSIAGATVEEGNSNNLRFVLTLSEASNDQITVNYRTIGRTAGDYDLDAETTNNINNGTVTFAPGTTTASIFVRASSDTVDERDEHVLLELINPVGASFAGGGPVLRSTGILLDVNGVGSNLAVFVSDPILIEPNAGTQEAVFEVRLSQPAPTATVLTYTTRDGTAVAGQDYTATSGTLSFVAGQDVAYVRVPVAGDRASEATESFFLVVTPPASPSVGSLGSVGTAFLLDNDSTIGNLPVVSISAEPAEEGGRNIRFVISLSGASALPVTVSFATLLGTAISADLGFGSTSGTVTIQPGQTSISVFIPISSDTLDERDETIIGQISEPVNAVLAGGQQQISAIGIIRDDDGTGSNLALVVQNQQFAETALAASASRVVVQLSRPIETAITFNVTATSGTATLGSDFQLVDSTVTFAPGQTTAALSVNILGDSLTEVGEVFFLDFTPVSGAPITGTMPRLSVTITDRVAPQFSVTTLDASRVEGNAGTTNSTFTVTRTGDSTAAATVNWSVAGFGAAPASAQDFAGGVLPSGTLNFAANQTAATITVAIAGDIIRENDEAFSVRLTSVSNGSVATAVAVGTIINDDVPVPGPQELFMRLQSGALLTWDSTRGSDGFRFLLTEDATTKAFLTADFNGDGKAELLFRQSSGGFIGWNIDQGGNGFFALPSLGAFQPITVGVGQFAIGDLRGSFGQDLLLQAPNGQLRILEVDTGVVTDLLTLAPGFSVVGVGNINGQGRDDIVFQNNNTGAIFALTDTGFVDLLTLGGGFRMIGLGNVTGSAADDFIFRNVNTGVTIFWDVSQGGNGFRDFATVGNEWTFSAFADFNGDGRDDILLRNINGNAIYWSGTSFVDMGSVLSKVELIGVSELG